MIATEIMTATQFLHATSLEAKFYRQPVLEDALSKTVIEIETNPYLAQSRLLTRILGAMAGSESTFRRADLTLLSVKALVMIDSVLQGRQSGQYSPADYRRAADRVGGAQRSADA